MFKNHYIGIKLVKADKTTSDKTAPRIEIDAEEISQTVKSLVRYATLAGISVMGAACVFNTFHDAVVISADNMTRRDRD